MANIIERLATSLGQKDQVPNIELAKQVIVEKNTLAVKVLIDNLYHKDKGIQSDCIKVLYEVGEKSPELISEYLHEFLNLLLHKNNRLQWGGMTAIHSITLDRAKEVHEALPQILKAAKTGSVITNDHAFGILMKLCSLEEYHKESLDLLLKQLKNAPDNQFPKYAEDSLKVIHEEEQDKLIHVLQARLNKLPQESKQKRVQNILKKLSPLKFEKSTQKKIA